jgi:hypothetical protein
MRCGRVRRKLMAYHDGELGLNLKGRIGKHLKTCEECSGLLGVLERGDRVAGEAGVPDPASEYWDTFTGRVMDRIRQETLTGHPKSQRAPARYGLSPAKLAPALSIALVAVVAAGVMMKIRQPVIPDHTTSLQDMTAEKETSLSPGEQTRVGNDQKEASYYSTPVKAAPVKEPEKPDTRQDVKQVLPETTMAMSTEKTEVAADEGMRIDAMQEETETEFRDVDGSLITATPYPSDEETIRSTLRPSAPEITGKARTSVETKQPLSKERAIDDGSWGQLAFARKLEEEGRHSESEKVLDDLLKRNTDPPIQEQASLLLVSVLANQNRLPEARQVLEGAQQRYPANMMIQNYELKEGK